MAEHEHLSRLKEALKAQGHRLLETEWLGWNAGYRFRCTKGHLNSRSGTQIIRVAVGCPTCRALEALQRLRALAKLNGGTCLTGEYLGRETRHEFRCAQGHIFEAAARKIVEGSWCRKCAQVKHGERMRDRHGLTRLNGIARQHGGECLSVEYKTVNRSYRFRCARGHEWVTSGAEVVRGAWCRLCADMQKSEAYRREDGLSELHRIAKSRGGQCFAESYDGGKAYYRFRCEKGHEWETIGARIFRGTWCFTCGHEGRRLGMDVMRELAAEHGGQCVSQTYVNSETKLQWECARGHRWHARPSNIRAGHWCIQCHILSLITRPKTRRRRRYEAVGV